MPEIYGVAGEYAARVFGGIIVSADKVVVVGVTVEPILSGESERVSFALMNMSTNIIYVGLDEAVGPTRGLILPANGGFLSMDITTNPASTGRAWFAIAAGANSNLYIESETRIQRIQQGGP